MGAATRPVSTPGRACAQRWRRVVAHVKQLLRGTKWITVAPSSRAPRAARCAVLPMHALTVRMDMSSLTTHAQSATRAASPAKPKPLSARRAPADTTRLRQEAHAHPASLTAEASLASRTVRAARLQPAALVLFSATSWGMAAGPLSSRPHAYVCTAARVTRIAIPLLGASHGGRVPFGAVSRAPLPLHAKPCRPTCRGLTVHLDCCPRLSGCSCWGAGS